MLNITERYLGYTIKQYKKIYDIANPTF